MVPIFIASGRSYSGKTFVALGLALSLIAKGYKVGYIKPIGKMPIKKGTDLFDADAMFIQETLSMDETLEVLSPLVLSYETQNMIFQGKLADVKEKMLKSFGALRDKDIVIIGGSADFFDGATIGVDTLSLIEDMDARALIVESWAGDGTADSLFGLAHLLNKRFLGGIINKVPENSVHHVRDTVQPFLEKKGVKVFGIFQKDNILESFSVRQLNEILNAKVLCCEDRLDELVEHFLIGAMDVDSALRYFRRVQNKAVITGAHRSDIQLAAIETSTKCIILTGGLYTNDIVIAKAQSKGIPVLSVTEDTFTTVDRIEAIMGKTRLRGKNKMERVQELFAQGFDLNRFLQELNHSK